MQFNNPFGNPFGNPFRSSYDTSPALPPYQNNLWRLQAAGVQPPEPSNRGLLNWVARAFQAFDTKTRNPIVTGLDTLAQEGDIGRALEDAWKAFKGEKIVHGADLMETLGVKNPWLKFAGGFAADVLLDPVTWLGGWGTVTRPAKEGLTSAWKGVMSKGTEKLGVEGAKEALKQTTKHYGDDLVRALTKQAVEKGINQNVAKEIINTSVREATKRGFTRGAAQEFATAMLEKSAKEGINKEIIAKTAKAFAKGSQKPLDVVGNYLAQKISDPAFKLGEKLGGVGPIGEAAVSLNDWLGNTFLGRHFPKVLPAGIMEHMADYNAAKLQLQQLKGSEEFSKILNKLGDKADNLDEILKAASSEAFNSKEKKLLKDYVGLTEFVSKNPYQEFVQQASKTPIKLIDEAVQKLRGKYVDIQLEAEKSLFKNLPKEDAEFLADAIEAPVDYVHNYLKSSKMNKELADLVYDATTREATYNKLKLMLKDKTLDSATRQKIAVALDVADTAASKLDDMIKSYATDDKHLKLLNKAKDSYFKTMQKLADKAGIPMEQRLRYYVPHIYDNPKALSKVSVDFVGRHPEVRNVLGTYNPYAQERIIPTLKEAEELGLKPRKDLFELQHRYAKQAAQTSVRKDLISSLIESGNIRPMNEVASGAWVKDTAALGIPELKGMAIHKETYDLLKQLDGVLTNNKELKSFGRVWDKVQNIWKTSVTAMRPSWYVKNTIGDVFNNYLAGVKDPSRYKVAYDIMSGNVDSASKYLANKLPKESISALKSMLGKDEVKDIKNTAELVSRVFEKNVGEKWGLTLGGPVWGSAEEVAKLRGESTGLLSKARDTAEQFRKNAQMALFIDGLIKGKSPKAAADLVKAAQFDYSDLTKVEKGIRRLVPFYTFTRKNLAFQLQTLLEHPERLKRVSDLQENLAAAHGFDMENMTEYQRMRALPIGEDKYLNLELPWSTLTQVTDPHALVNMLSPLIKTPIELATNRSMFSGQPIQTAPELGTNWQEVMSYLFDQFGATRELSGAIAAAGQTGDYMKQQERTTMPQLGSDSDNPLIRLLGAIGYPVVRGYDAAKAKEYREKQYQRQLAALIQALQSQGYNVPTVREIRRR